MGLWELMKSVVRNLAVTTLFSSPPEQQCSEQFGCWNPNEQVCFDDLGCFSIVPPYGNAGSYLSNTPDEIGTQFLLYTRKNMDLPVAFDTQKTGENSGFKADPYDEDANVIVVDWEKGAALGYEEASSNIRVVGALTAQLIKHLRYHMHADHNKFRVIGHGLGAHVAAHVGKGVKGIGRITGLDPAGRYFSGDSSAVRLDKNDATVVDVIHTDGEPLMKAGFGSYMRLGHADFYPNGGTDQPGCNGIGSYLWKAIKGKFDGAAVDLACDHARARALYTESIRGSPFKSVPCGNYQAYMAGNCTCDGSCARMGHYAVQDQPRGTYYLTTNAVPPYDGLSEMV